MLAKISIAEGLREIHVNELAAPAAAAAVAMGVIVGREKIALCAGLTRSRGTVGARNFCSQCRGIILKTEWARHFVGVNKKVPRPRFKFFTHDILAEDTASIY
jgi:hypothetical protein